MGNQMIRQVGNKTDFANIHKSYWILMITVFIGVSYYNLFFDWQLQRFDYQEAEDFGRYVFVLAISITQSFIYIQLIRPVVWLMKRIAVSEEPKN